ncbi:glycosyltransferase family 34 protein [Sporormia fimetaria CBS 119925]|uniref:Glycosyltransferase family 34 protein n=1 Tax=Sporormia fimetaria CBS 119925 TaxID=1340428 RepID=A0A6A6VMY4_9PLEO|nr:glycosyltransferase family 34 protein [Sporormia fimetaria CBS 119925]
MFVRALRRNPSLILFLVICLLVGWQLGAREGDLRDVVSPIRERYAAAQASLKEEPKQKNRLAIVTFVTDQRSYLHLSLKNHDHYARRHGYDFIIDYEAHPPLGTPWWKLDMLERLIKLDKWDWLWWMDFDTLIMDTGIKVTDIINETLATVPDPDKIEYLLTHDCNGLNSGSYILRSRQSAIDLMNLIRAFKSTMEKGLEEDRQLSEQDVMGELFKVDKNAAERTVRVQQQKLNAFPKEIACFDHESHEWQPHDFVIHFAGAWAHVKGDDPTGQLMKKYEPWIKWGDWDSFDWKVGGKEGDSGWHVL